MGVYLPNVDMPKGDKVLTVQICPDGSIWQQYRGTVPNAKAVPIPPHGRLIDADALRAKQQEDADLFQGSTAYCDKCRRDEAMNAVANIVNAPTIIPAEPSKEENK